MIPSNNNSHHFTAIIQVNLRSPAPPVKNLLHDFVGAKFYCLYALAGGNQSAVQRIYLASDIFVQIDLSAVMYLLGIVLIYGT